ncbi:hypothetical protein POM88_011246 [Heracleum sosnowskyi]|uniref:Uncharacterized protein n=1 Tax=Heracleum sosnowskyi TaxID=360622 RepID=A0AAD8MWC2_9APIA|nr:hypothetical protein POM88_011246 [Heracleum sosnowskyi]
MEKKDLMMGLSCFSVTSFIHYKLLAKLLHEVLRFSSMLLYFRKPSKDGYIERGTCEEDRFVFEWKEFNFSTRSGRNSLFRFEGEIKNIDKKYVRGSLIVNLDVHYIS